MMALICAALLTGACSEQKQKEAQAEFQEELQDAKEDLGLAKKQVDKSRFDFKDHGGEPFTVDIEEYTEANDNFRTTIWTGSTLQLTLMSIPVGGDIGAEIHANTEQFIRLESGKGEVYFGDTQESMQPYRVVEGDDIVIVPKGKWHNIKNIGDEPMKLYSLYAPVEHERGTIHVTMAEGQAAEHH